MESTNDNTPSTTPPEDQPIREIDLDNVDSLEVDAPTIQKEALSKQWQQDTKAQQQATEATVNLDDEQISNPENPLATKATEMPDTDPTLSPDELKIHDQEMMQEGGGEVTLSRITTYQDAVKEALQSQTMSSAKMLMAEQRRRNEREEEVEKNSIRTPRNKLLLLIALLLFFLGIGAILLIFFTNNQDGGAIGPRNTITETFFEADEIVTIPEAQIGRNTIAKIQQTLDEQLRNANTLRQIIITKEVNIDPSSPVTIFEDVPYTTNDIFALTESRIPDSLRRSLSSSYMLGVLPAGEFNQPFLLFKVDDFNNAYTGMLGWERTLTTDMSSIFNRSLGAILQTIENEREAARQAALANASTSSSTVAVAPTPRTTIADQTLFIDEVIANTDARSVKNRNNYTVFYYTFINEDYLLLTTHVRVLNEVRKRIRSAKLVI